MRRLFLQNCADYRRVIILLAALGLQLNASPADANNTSTAETDGDKKWEQTLKQGIDNLDANRYWLAEPLLKQAVIEAGEFGANDMRLAKSLGELGRLYAVRGRFADAEPLLEEELFVKQQTLAKEGDELVPAMGSLIKFYLSHGTVSKADALTEEMLAIVEGKLREPANKPKTKITKVNGEIVLEAWAGTASEVMRNPFIEWAITCDSVGTVCMTQEKFDLAERLFKAALEVKETVLGKTHLSLANSYDSLGGLALAEKDFLTAESHLKDAYEMTKKILPASTPQVYGRLDKLAKCLIAAGKRKDAEELYLSAQNFWKEEPSRTGDHFRALYALGNMYCEDKNYEAAAPILLKAVQSAQEYHGPDSAALIPYLQRYAYVLYYLGQKPLSDEIKSRVAAISGPT